MFIIKLDGENRKVSVEAPNGYVTIEERDIMREFLDNLFDIGWEKE